MTLWILLLVIAFSSSSAEGPDQAGKSPPKLPFSAGSVVTISSAWLDYDCDVHESKWALSSANKAAPKFEKNTVFCDVTPDADDYGKGGDCQGYWDCSTHLAKKAISTLMRPFRSMHPRSFGGWNQAGYILLGLDFKTADIVEGGPVQLKNQNSFKFCRVSPDMWTVVCDSKTSAGPQGGGSGDGADQTFELVMAPKDLALAALAAAGLEDSDSPYWPPKPSKPVPLLLRSSLNKGRYCGPDEHLDRSAPITCNIHVDDLKSKHVLLFTSNNPY